MREIYTYSPRRPDPVEVMGKLKEICEQAKTHHRGRVKIISAWKIDQRTKDMYPHQLTINLANPGEVQFARNLSQALEQCYRDPRSRQRLPEIMEWLGGLG